MSEVDSRPAPARGRSSMRGGRAGHGRGGPRGGHKPPYANGTAKETAHVEESLEDQGELGNMKKKYAPQLGMLKDMFPDWTDVDLVYALQEADGDVTSTVDKITQGNVSQFSDVKKKTKDRARSKVKDEPTAAGTTSDKAVGSTRGARGRGGFDSTRGGRGRGAEHGRGGFRGGRGGHATTNGTQKEAVGTSVPTMESSAWDTPAPAENVDKPWDDTAPTATAEAADGAQSQGAVKIVYESVPAALSEGPRSGVIPDSGPKKSWASMFAPKPAPPMPKMVPAPKAAAVELAASSQPATMEDGVTEVAKEPEPLLPPPTIQDPETAEKPPALDPDLIEPSVPRNEGENLVLIPSGHPLTEDNLECLPDVSHPPATHTAASTTGSADPRNSTPLPPQQAPIGRPPMGGYATSAYRATGVPGRSASYIRKLQEQQEAVVMPGHNAVDRATVQFGSMGLNGDVDLDVDDDREEPETRAQPPQQSPPSQPRASLPPAPRQPSAPQDHQGIAESLPMPKQAPGLPPASQQNQQQQHQALQQDSAPTAAIGQGVPQDPSQQQMNQYAQYGRYNQGVMQQEQAVPPQKTYDPFSHQAQPSQYDQYSQQAQQHSQQPQPHQQQQSSFGGLSSAPNEYSNYYTSDQQRNAYQQYYAGGYGQQTGQHQQQQQDSGISQQRSASGFGAGPSDAFTSAQSMQQEPQHSRFTAAPGSGHNTPNPPTGAALQQGHHQPHQSQQQQQQGGYGGGTGYPYGHPYYSSPYPQAYQSSLGFNQQQQHPGGYGAGGPYGKQQGMYGQPHSGYGGSMGPGSAYDQHSSSPANTGAFGQNQHSSIRSTSGMGAGLGGSLDDYGRTSSGPSQHQQSSAFGGMSSDPFARSHSGFGGQTGGYGTQQGMPPDPNDSLKPFGDSKSGDPSPGLGQPGRPGSAANSAGGNAQTGLPPPNSHQPGFGGGFLSYAGSSQYGGGGLGGLGGHQQGQSQMGQQSGYGQYGAGAFGQYSNYGRGGWGQSYGGH